MTSQIFLNRLGLAFSLCLLTGCASVQFDDYLENPAKQRAEVEKKSIRSKTRPVKAMPDFPAKCGWNQVTYCGEVVFAQGSGGPVGWARVALMEGDEELCSTETGDEGCFEMTCDLYGKPVTVEDGVCRWCPEEYYALVALEQSGGKGKVLLRDTPLGKRVRITVD